MYKSLNYYSQLQVMRFPMKTTLAKTAPSLSTSTLKEQLLQAAQTDATSFSHLLPPKFSQMLLVSMMLYVLMIWIVIQVA